MHKSFLTTFASACLMVAFIVGCSGGSATVKVKGTLEVPANTKLLPTDSITVNFFTDEKGGGSGTATVQPESRAFSVKGIAPGKYRVAVQIVPYAGEKGSEQRAAEFAALNKSHDQQNTKLTHEITSQPEQSIVVDIAKGTVTSVGAK